MTASKPVIVGAGPAGLHAAIELARRGQASVLLDEASKIGGVVYRGPLRSGVDLARFGVSYRRKFERLHADFEAHRALIDLRLQTRVVGAEGDRLLVLEGGERVTELPVDDLVVATGCHERSVPFPGWTRPGVMLLGGLQLQCKSGGVRPHEPVAIVGSGPLPVLVACQLHRSGVTVAGVFDAAPLRKLVAQRHALLHQPRLLLEGLAMLAYLKRHRVPVFYGWGIVSAGGRSDTVEEITVAPYDADWCPQLARSKRLRCGTLGVGYGLLPRTQVSQLLGLAHALRDDGALAPVVDEGQRSRRAGVLVAGDTAGVLGGDAAALQGRIAALSILERRGALSSEAASALRRPLQAELRRWRAFRAGWERASQPGPGMLELAGAGTVVCRCENVTRGQIDAAIAEGVTDLASLKMRTRAGMGDCQGKVCIVDCAERLRCASGRSDVGWLRPRFPLDPIPFAGFKQP